MRFVVVAVVLSLTALTTLPASAEGAAPAGAHAKPAKRAKAEKKGIPSERFRQEIEGRIARARDRLERHLEKRRLPEASATALRTDFNAGVLQVRARVAAVSKDGVVSRDEAREVRGMVRQIRTRPR